MIDYVRALISKSDEQDGQQEHRHFPQHAVERPAASPPQRGTVRKDCGWLTSAHGGSSIMRNAKDEQDREGRKRRITVPRRRGSSSRWQTPPCTHEYGYSRRPRQSPPRRRPRDRAPIAPPDNIYVRRLRRISLACKRSRRPRRLRISSWISICRSLGETCCGSWTSSTALKRSTPPYPRSHFASVEAGSSQLCSRVRSCFAPRLFAHATNSALASRSRRSSPAPVIAAIDGFTGCRNDVGKQVSRLERTEPERGRSEPCAEHAIRDDAGGGRDDDRRQCERDEVELDPMPLTLRGCSTRI